MALPKPKTKAGFFALERKTWNKLNAQTKRLPRTAWTESGAAGEWSLKDVYAHLADWMIETRRRVPEMLSQEKLRPVNIPEFNRAHYTRNRKLSLAQARKRLEHEHKIMLAFLKILPDDALLRNKRVYSWASFSTYNHYAEHIPDLARFRRRILQRLRRANR